MLLKLETARVYELAQSIISRYVHEEIDAAYIVYNEFKSVIQQRLVVEKLLPLIEDRQPADCRRRPSPPRKSASAPAKPPSAGITLEPADTKEPTKKPSVSAPPSRLHLRAARRGTASTACSRNTFFPCCITP
jgi:F-type H+-transporting ATPase subunit gamma